MRQVLVVDVDGCLQLVVPDEAVNRVIAGICHVKHKSTLLVCRRFASGEVLQHRAKLLLVQLAVARLHKAFDHVR